MGGDDRRALIRQKMLELERLKQQEGLNEEDEEDDEGLFGDEDDMPVVVTDGGNLDAFKKADEDSQEE